VPVSKSMFGGHICEKDSRDKRQEKNTGNKKCAWK
jgi:hypothetical protein